MIISMTGYGRNRVSFEDKTIVVELRSLNSKFFDLNMRIPQIYREKEIGIRNMISESLNRGKVDCSISIEEGDGAQNLVINNNLFKSYTTDLKALSKELNLNDQEVLSAVMRIPNVVQPGKEELNDEEWSVVEGCFKNAIKALNGFRESEGEKLQADLIENVNSIHKRLEDIKLIDPQRKEKVRERLRIQLNKMQEEDSMDQNRFEQELIYYIEKMDINEEIVRLESHCSYFKDTVKETSRVKGKKLGFIGQEMGREINTIGSKAYHADIQKLVVQMKDELEKVKEQVQNIV